ncbi:MAG TPA: hypothetical protein VIK74_07955 [Parasegetibacter sp.]|jgi:hypothetical protein
MQKEQLYALLIGGDLRSIGSSNYIVSIIKSQDDFDVLFSFLFCSERLAVMRAADSVEKITAIHPEFLKKYKKKILNLLEIAENKELKWHIPELIPRVKWNKAELEKIRMVLTAWVLNKNESRIVRVNALQSLFDIMQQIQVVSSAEISGYRKTLQNLMTQVEKEGIPSLNSRIRKLRKGFTALFFVFWLQTL